jgi:hypothetical protein
MHRGGLRVPHGLGPLPSPEASIRTRERSFMIAKGFTPENGAKVFAIMEISRLTARQAWLAATALPAR